MPQSMRQTRAATQSFRDIFIFWWSHRSSRSISIKATRFIMFPWSGSMQSFLKRFLGKGELWLYLERSLKTNVWRKRKYAYMFHVCIGYMFSGGKYYHLSFSKSWGIPSRLREHCGGNAKKVGKSLKTGRRMLWSYFIYDLTKLV